MLLSLLNLLAHYHNLALFRQLAVTIPKRPDGRSVYPFKGLTYLYGVININAWLWSAVFHARSAQVKGWNLLWVSSQNQG